MHLTMWTLDVSGCDRGTRTLTLTLPAAPSLRPRAGIIVTALMAAFLGQPGWAAATEIVITFDETTGLAPTSSGTTIPGGEFGPELDFGDVVIDGGVIRLAITPSDVIATTLPNLYATTDYLPLADGSLLPGLISGDLAAPASSIALNVGNGGPATAELFLTAYSGLSVVAVDSVILAPFGSLQGFSAPLSVSGTGITRFEVSSNQPAGAIDFGIDTVAISIIPEPGTGVLLLTGLVLGLLPRQLRLSGRS